MNRKEKRGIVTSLITGFIGLAYEGISSFLHNRRHKAVKAMESKSNIENSKLIHLDNSMVMCGVYSTETLEKLKNTIHCMHNTKTLHENLFAGQLTAAFRWYINSHGNQGVQHYARNSLQNTQADSYMHLQVDRPYIALNSETYITIRHQELRTCKRIGYKFYCKQLFVVNTAAKVPYILPWTH